MLRAIQILRLHAVFAEPEKLVDLFQESPLVARDLAGDAFDLAEDHEGRVFRRAGDEVRFVARSLDRGHAIGVEHVVLRPVAHLRSRVGEHDHPGETDEIERLALARVARILSLSCLCLVFKQFGLRRRNCPIALGQNCLRSSQTVPGRDSWLLRRTA